MRFAELAENSSPFFGVVARCSIRSKSNAPDAKAHVSREFGNWVSAVKEGWPIGRRSYSYGSWIDQDTKPADRRPDGAKNRIGHRVNL